MKKSRILAALTVLIMVLCLFTPAYAVTEEAELRGIYGDGMLFRQLDEVNLSGTASPGKVISAELKNDEGETVKSSSAVTGADGSFCVSFTAPAGGFSEYTVEMKKDGKVFRVLSRVVFGELWLASGQSNMQYPLSQAKSAAEDFANGVKQSK